LTVSYPVEMGSTDTDGRTPLTVIPLNVRLPSESDAIGMQRC
jgi:hypothetical protein